MPTISLKNVAAGTANALDGLSFQDVPAGGAIVTIYATTAVAGGNISYRVGREDFLVSAEVNIEASADVVDVDRDLVLFREPVPSGKQFLAVAAQVCNLLVVLEEIA